jgi:hypothetical protein
MYSTNNSAFQKLFYFNLILGILLVFIGILSFLNFIDGGITISISSIGLGLTSIIWTIIRAKSLVALELTEDEILISANGKIIKKEWGDLNKIKIFPFNSIPLYSMKFKNDKKKYFFTAERNGPEPDISLWDFLKRKKLEIDSINPKNK